MEYGLLVASEMEAFIRVLATAGPGRMPDAAERQLHAELHEYLQPALDRFAALETDDEREGVPQARCGTTCGPTASSRRSSTGATGTWSGSTSTAGCC